MEESDNKYYAIILSSTYQEDEEFILKFLGHVSDICKSVSKKYSVLPVLVFEQSENKKKLFIQNRLLSEKVDVMPLLLTNNKGKGFASCLNYGIKNTNSKFIFRLDTDDRTKPKRIIDQLEVMNSKNSDLCCGNMEDENGKILKYPPSLIGMALMVSLGTNPIAHPSVCFRRESLYLLYNENYERCEDFDLWLRFYLTSSLKINVLDKPITKYNTVRSLQKDRENAIYQIKIRFKFIKKISLVLLVLLLGLIPNILRLVFFKNFLLSLRRKL